MELAKKQTLWNANERLKLSTYSPLFSCDKLFPVYIRKPEYWKTLRCNLNRKLIHSLIWLAHKRVCVETFAVVVLRFDASVLIKQQRSSSETRSPITIKSFSPNLHGYKVYGRRRRGHFCNLQCSSRTLAINRPALGNVKIYRWLWASCLRFIKKWKFLAAINWIFVYLALVLFTY